MIDESLLYSAVKHALELGAEYVETRFQRDYGFSISLRNGKILGAGSSRKSGVGIRVLVNGSLGFSSTNIVDRESILEAVEKAVARAKSLSSLRKNPIKFSTERVGKASYQVMVKRKLEDLVVEDIVEMGSSLYKTLTSELARAKIPVTTFSVETHTQEKLVITSEGAYVYSVIPRIYVDSNNVLFSPEKGTLQRMVSFAASGGLELIDEWKPVETIVDEMKRLENVLINGVQPPQRKSGCSGGFGDSWSSCSRVCWTPDGG